MLLYILKNQELVNFIGIITVFLLTYFLTLKLNKYLPRDGGREFAHDGKLSAGKPRGAGIIFVISFIFSYIVFCKQSTEIYIYMFFLLLSMLTGYLDDASKNPWGEYKKGILDLIIAVGLSITFYVYNGSEIFIPVINQSFELAAPIFILLSIILIWASVNVTNCTDGVDGLSASLSITTMIGIIFITGISDGDKSFNTVIILFIMALLAYLWFNSTPSLLMMGDAGSRAMGLFIAIAILKTNSPFVYFLLGLLMILDGGLGLIKVALLRFFKIKILKNTRTPLHDHVRKNKGWSNTQTVNRFVIMQIIVVIITIYLYKI